MKVPGITGCKMDMVQRPMLMEVRLAKMWLAASSFPDGHGQYALWAKSPKAAILRENNSVLIPEKR